MVEFYHLEGKTVQQPFRGCAKESLVQDKGGSCSTGRAETVDYFPIRKGYGDNFVTLV
jgi:hypothetical protein